MATGRLRRFLHLEPPARPGEAREPEPATGSEERVWRFWSIRRLRRPLRRSTSRGSPGRFGPEHVPPAEVVGNDAGTRPVVRCQRCGTEAGVLAPRCRGCGADLDTASQREFDERWWRDRQAEAQRKAAAEAERRLLQARAWRELERPRGGGEEREPPRRPSVAWLVGAGSALVLALLWILLRASSLR